MADEAKSDYEKQIQALKDQVVELENSLKWPDQQKDIVVKAAMEEEKNVAEEAIAKLKFEHEDALVKTEDQGWDEATYDVADQIRSLKDIIYEASYDFGLESAGIPNDHELHAKIVLCPPVAFIAAVLNPSEVFPADEEESNVEENPQPQT